MSRLDCRISLPANFRADDFLAYHRRDVQEIAERVGPHSVHKGLIYAGSPACLAIHFHPSQAEASLTLDADRANVRPADFEQQLHRMLGLDQDIEAFEARHRTHLQIGPLITRQAGLRVPQAATPFEALSWAITGQQISVSAAVSIRRKLILATHIRHSSGLLCYPSATELMNLSAIHLRQVGFSASKARTLLTLASHITAGTLALDNGAETPSLDALRARLQSISGIGPWTTHYALLRGFGHLDGALHGDVAVRRALQNLLGSTEKLSADDTLRWLAPFSPWRALIAAHLWASLSHSTQ